MIGYGQMAQKTFIKNKQDSKIRPLKTVNINLELEKKMSDQHSKKVKTNIYENIHVEDS